MARAGFRKLVDADVPGLRARLTAGETTVQQEADYFACGCETIRRAWRGETFRHVLEGLAPPKSGTHPLLARQPPVRAAEVEGVLASLAGVQEEAEGAARAMAKLQEEAGRAPAGVADRMVAELTEANDAALVEEARRLGVRP